MLTHVTLGGPLGARFGRTWRLALDFPSPAEAVRALCAVCPGFRGWLLEHSEPGFHVLVGRKDVGEDELAAPAGASRITILPALAGAKDPGFQVVLGAVLLAAGVAVGIGVGWTGLGALGAGALVNLGGSLVVGGVSQLLFGAPREGGVSERPENTPSYAFNGPVNTLAQGHPVPILYGELEVGSQVVSAGIVTEWGAGGGFGGGNAEPTGPGGTGPVGGACPAPWVPILLADGREVPAGHLEVGMVLRTQHEETLAWGDFRVEAVVPAEGVRWRLTLEDGRDFVGTGNHRVRAERGWCEVRELLAGDVLLGARPGVVRRVAREGYGLVMRISVEGARTYQSAGFLSHNVKKADP